MVCVNMMKRVTVLCSVKRALTWSEMYPGHVLVSSDTETVIQDAQNSSECINLDVGRTKSKHWRPIGFRNFVSNLEGLD